MNTVSAIIDVLIEEEKRNFIIKLKQRNRRGDTKNVELFKILDAAPNTANIDQLLYGKPAKGAYHALCKRLHDNLIDFIAANGFENEQSEEMHVFKLVLASRIFFEKAAYKVAFKTLNKAELQAKKNDFFSVLNEIYYTKFQYAHINDVNFQELVLVFENNKRHLEQTENINLFYAQIQQDIKNNKLSVTEILEKRVNQSYLQIDENLSYPSLYKLLEVTNKLAHLKNDFNSVLPFVNRLLDLVNKKQVLKSKHVFYHIHILYFIANIYFRNRNYQKAMYYLQLMRLEIESNKMQYEKTFCAKYALLYGFNLNYIGRANDAIDFIEDFDFSLIKNQLEDVVDLKLLLAVLGIQQKQFKKASSVFLEFNHSDQFYIQKIGENMVIKKNLVEIILQIELDNFELVESRIKSFRKKHKAYLILNKEDRVLQFLLWVSAYYFKKEKLVTDSLVEKINMAFTAEKMKDADIFVLSFFAWLKAKLANTNVYETTLSIVNTKK